MGLLNKLLGRGNVGEPAHVSEFRESETTIDKAKASNQSRRELVQLVLRETMRKHGIPSGWIDARVLSVVTRQHKSGMHVQFIVRQGDEQLLHYVHAFQASFWERLDKFEPHANRWLFSVAWQFEGKGLRDFFAMPAPGAWKAGEDARDTQPPEHDADTQPADGNAEELATDLQALYAAMSQPAAMADLRPAKPRPHRGPGGA